MQKKLMILIAGISIVLTSGCQGPTEGSRMKKTPVEHQHNLVYIDYELTEHIPCEKLEATVLESGRTQVYARFYNKQNQTAECQIQIKFKDISGKTIDETGWMPFLLSRREVTEFRHTSLVRNPADFVLLLRVAH